VCFLPFVNPPILLKRAIIVEQLTRSQEMEKYSNAPLAVMQMTLT
jgi:hypothetical protein